jgi:hypothetical protein
VLTGQNLSAKQKLLAGILDKKKKNCFSPFNFPLLSHVFLALWIKKKAALLSKVLHIDFYYLDWEFSKKKKKLSQDVSVYLVFKYLSVLKNEQT